MHFNSVIAGSILAFCASASAWTEEDYSLYARDAGLLDSNYDYDYDLYGREAEPEPEANYGLDYDVDYLHPRDAYNYGLYIGELNARSVPTTEPDAKHAASKPDAKQAATKPGAKHAAAGSAPSTEVKKSDVKSHLANSSKASTLSATEKAQRAALKKAENALMSTIKAEKKNNADLRTEGKKISRRSLYERDW